MIEVQKKDQGEVNGQMEKNMLYILALEQGIYFMMENHFYIGEAPIENIPDNIEELKIQTD